MYVYDKKNFKHKVIAIVVSSALLLIACLSLLLVPDSDDALMAGSTVSDLPVLTIPSEMKQEEKAVRPYAVEAVLARAFFDSAKTDEQLAQAVVEFEGVYRPNQGADYTFNNTSFEVMAVFSGTVSEIREDALLGKTVSIQSENCTITYQSLSDVQVSVDDQVVQGEVIASSGESMYDSSLGNHLHLVVMKDQKLIDPETIFSKTIAQIE